MNRKLIILILAVVLNGTIFHAVSAATIPAGTIVLVKTSTTIYSRDNAGKKFQGELARPLGVNGKVVVPAGTSVDGLVKSPLVRVGSTTRPLTLRLAHIVVKGHAVPIKTDDFEAENSSPWQTRRGIQVTGGAFLLQSGTILQFRLTQPVDI